MQHLEQCTCPRFLPASMCQLMSRPIRHLPKFLHDYVLFSRASRSKDNGFPITRLYPILGEHVQSAGVASGQYFHQDLYVAQRIFELGPRRHVDIGSRVDGFIAHVAVFRAIEVVDVGHCRLRRRTSLFSGRICRIGSRAAHRADPTRSRVSTPSSISGSDATVTPSMWTAMCMASAIRQRSGAGRAAIPQRSDRAAARRVQCASSIRSNDNTGPCSKTNSSSIDSSFVDDNG